LRFVKVDSLLLDLLTKFVLSHGKVTPPRRNLFQLILGECLTNQQCDIFFKDEAESILLDPGLNQLDYLVCVQASRAGRVSRWHDSTIRLLLLLLLLFVFFILSTLSIRRVLVFIVQV
jgi:hypothetical protein